VLLPGSRQESLLVQHEAYLNKLLSDRRASIAEPKINERSRTEVQKVFS